MNQKIQEHNEKLKPLKEMELFVLDNSLRESTVAQLRGHTIENKWKIYEEVSHVLYSTVKVAKRSGKEHISLFIYLFNRFQHDYNARTREGKK